MHRLALVASLFALMFAVACGDGTGAEDQTVATPPSDYGESPAATSGDVEINDRGTKTFTTEEFEAEIEMDNEGDDFYFEPTYIKSPGGSTASITLHNAGDIQHTFTIDALDVDEELAPDEEKTITVEIGTESRYDFYCRFHSGQGMRGAFQPH